MQAELGLSAAETAEALQQFIVTARRRQIHRDRHVPAREVDHEAVGRQRLERPEAGVPEKREGGLERIACHVPRVKVIGDLKFLLGHW
ncbi:MAG: hypothetical protein WDM84_07050 [Bauldia sp.]